MKRRRKRKILSALVMVLVLAGTAAGITFAVKKISAAAEPVTVVQVSELRGKAGESGSSSSGRVTGGSVQQVVLGEDEVVQEVRVQTGDQVKQGDVLLVYDTEAISQKLEREKLEQQDIDLKIQIARKNLDTLSRLTPVQEDSDGTENEYSADPVLNTVLDGNSQYFYFLDSDADPGSEKNPYRFLAQDGAAVNGDFITLVKSLEGSDGGKFFMIEIRSGNDAGGVLLKGWLQNADNLADQDSSWSAVVDSDSSSFIIPQKAAETPASTTDSGTDNGENSQNSTGQDVTEAETDQAANETAFRTSSAGAANLCGYAVSLRNLRLNSAGGTPGAGAVFTASSASGSSGDYEGSETDVSVIPSTAKYTQSEINSAITAQESAIKELQLDKQELDLKIKKAEEAVSHGEETAEADGVVIKTGDPANPPTDGSAFLQVQTETGISIRGGLTEQQYGKVKEGDTITVQVPETGTSYQASITTISRYPDSSGLYSDETGATVYPFVAVVSDAGADLKSGNEVNIVIDDQSEEQEESALLLDRAFIRTDADIPYVYMRGADGTLVKQTVSTGSVSGGSCEITGGLTIDDWVAFPYGSRVREGAKTEEGTAEDIYGGE